MISRYDALSNLTIERNASFGVWRLRLGESLEPGAWSLDLFFQAAKYFFNSSPLASLKSLSLPFLKDPSFNFRVIWGGQPAWASTTFSTTPTSREILCTIVSPR